MKKGCGRLPLIRDRQLPENCSGVSGSADMSHPGKMNDVNSECTARWHQRRFFFLPDQTGRIQLKAVQSQDLSKCNCTCVGTICRFRRRTVLGDQGPPALISHEASSKTRRIINRRFECVEKKTCHGQVSWIREGSRREVFTLDRSTLTLFGNLSKVVSLHEAEPHP